MVFLVLNLVSMMIFLVFNLGSYHYVPVIAQCFSDDVCLVYEPGSYHYVPLIAQCFSDYVPAVTPALSYHVLSLLLYVIPFLMSLRLNLPSVIMFLVFNLVL
jgi:hypothetical protein